jgi:hypothetical protein
MIIYLNKYLQSVHCQKQLSTKWAMLSAVKGNARIRHGCREGQIFKPKKVPESVRQVTKRLVSSKLRELG